MIPKLIKSTFIAASIFAMTFAFAKDKDGMMDAKEKIEMKGMSSDMCTKDKMGQSNMDCMAVCDSMNVLLKTVQAARKSNDKSKMQVALQLTETHLTQMKAHMEGSMDKMKKTENKQESANHEKHHPQ